MAFSSVLHDLLGLLSRQQMTTKPQVKKRGEMNVLSRTTNILNRRPLFTLKQVRRPGIWKQITFFIALVKTFFHLIGSVRFMLLFLNFEE